MKRLAWLLGLLAAPAMAQDWKIDAAHSQLRFVIKQMNVPVEGGFRRIAAHARFDPERIEAGQFRVEVDVGSIDTGSSEGDDEVKRSIWFDSVRHPKATFQSRSLRKEAQGRYSALGELAIKGQARAVAVPFTLSRQPSGVWLAEGRYMMKRSDFGIGGGDWNEVVANEVELRFRLFLTP